MKDLMKKFNKVELKPASTLMSTAAVMDLDENSETINQREYRSMIGPVLYLTVTRLNI
jgi:ABC-type arginine/histidine transport system permease subunit